jgi:TIR domain
MHECAKISLRMGETPNQHEQRLRVFLCHSSGDKPAVRDLYRRLRDDGFDPWLDDQDLLPGQDWQEEIPKAVHRCHVFAVCLSRASVGKEGFLQREIKYPDPTR